MADLEIRLRENGPLVVTMPVKVVDHDGKEIPIAAGKPSVALCRCGHSANKPFCDGSHKAAAFQSGPTVPPAPPQAMGP